MSQRRNQKGNKNYLKRNENRNTTQQNLWDAANAVLRGKLITIREYYEQCYVSMNSTN